jgi:hypothetical protein
VTLSVTAPFNRSLCPATVDFLLFVDTWIKSHSKVALCYFVWSELAKTTLALTCFWLADINLS